MDIALCQCNQIRDEIKTLRDDLSCEALSSVKLLTSSPWEHAACMPDWDTNQYQVLNSRSDFSGSLSTLSLGDKFNICFEHIDTGMISQLGAPILDKIAIVFFLEGSAIINGRKIENDLYLFSKVGIRAFAKQKITLAIMTFDPEFFVKKFGCSSAHIESSNPFEMSIGMGQLDLRCLRENLKQLMYSTSISCPGAVVVSQVSALFNCLRSSLVESKFAHPFDEISNRQFIFDAAIKVMADHYRDEALEINDICDSINVSRRTLQYSFTDISGINPRNYLRILRLNDAYRNLLNNSGESIQNVAMDAGFNHIGRFSQYYKDFFGELPSSTLRRGEVGGY